MIPAGMLQLQFARDIVPVILRILRRSCPIWKVIVQGAEGAKARSVPRKLAHFLLSRDLLLSFLIGQFPYSVH